MGLRAVVLWVMRRVAMMWLCLGFSFASIGLAVGGSPDADLQSNSLPQGSPLVTENSPGS